MTHPVIDVAIAVDVPDVWSRAAVDDNRAAENLWRALDFLGQTPEIGLQTAPLKDLWAWATASWDPFVLPGAQKGRD